MKKRIIPFILIAPFLILMLLFCVGMINGVIQSLGIIPAFGLNKPTLKYYIEVLQNKNLLQSIGYSLWIAVISSLLSSLLGTIICYVIISIKKSKSVWINIVKLPILIPHTIVAIFTISIFSQTGILSRILFYVGLIKTSDDFPNLLFNSNGIGIVLAYLWKEIPFVCYFIMAVMANVSENLEQAAMGLGATRIKSFLNITLPICMPSIRNAFFIILAFSFGAYELPYLLGATIPKALPVMAYIEYTHPDLKHRPYAMVLNVIMMLLSLLICILYFKYLRKTENNNEK